MLNKAKKGFKRLTDGSGSRPRDPHDPDPTLAQPAPPAKKRRVTHTTWTGLRALVGVLEGSADVFGPLKTAVDGLFKCVEIVE
ncbi:hypothetical protein FRC09_018634, partial [Ceratobasidium sp. 395]